MLAWIKEKEQQLIRASTRLGAAAAAAIAALMFVLRLVSGTTPLLPKWLIFIGWALLAVALLNYLLVLFNRPKTTRSCSSIVLHVGLLIALSALAAGEIFGISGKVYIPEGKTTAFWFDADSRPHRLPFELTNQSFRAFLYDGTTKISHYESVIDVKEGKTVSTRRISVNRPLEIAGYDLFLTSYGIEPLPDAYIDLALKEKNKTSVHRLQVNVPVALDDATVIKVSDFSPSLAFNGTSAYTFNKNAVLKPGYFVEVVFPNKFSSSQWVLPSEPNTQSMGDLHFDFRGFRHIQYIELDIAKTPLKIWVYAGLLTALAGLVALWCSLRRNKK